MNAAPLLVVLLLGATEPGARALEARLYAPCCYQQTLDVHESELARSLRTEIAKRLQVGEAASSIEEDLVLRYGGKIRATPSEAPLSSIGGLVVVAFVLAALAGLFVLFGWVRKRGQEAAVATGVKETDGLDARLDDELADLDEPAHKSPQ
ncbi:MAG: cytochrome c-type biogenesis protein CcmH [Myxococcales bacterium]